MKHPSGCGQLMVFAPAQIKLQKDSCWHPQDECFMSSTLGWMGRKKDCIACIRHYAWYHIYIHMYIFASRIKSQPHLTIRAPSTIHTLQIHSFKVQWKYSKTVFLLHLWHSLSLNVSTTPIMAMGCRQCLPLSVVHCRKPHCHKGVVDMLGLNFRSAAEVHGNVVKSEKLYIWHWYICSVAAKSFRSKMKRERKKKSH